MISTTSSKIIHITRMLKSLATLLGKRGKLKDKQWIVYIKDSIISLKILTK